jgi:hypothetical protein
LEKSVNGVQEMRVILDIDQVVREMKLSTEALVKWKAANLEQVQEGGASSKWPALEESGFLDKSYSSSTDLKTG